jgi:hypothetical protein
MLQTFCIELRVENESILIIRSCLQYLHGITKELTLLLVEFKLFVKKMITK